MESEQDNAEQTSRQPDAHHEPDPERDTSSGAGRPTGQQHPGTDPNARPEAAPAESSTEFPGDTQGNAPGGPASGPGDPVTGTAGAGTSAPGDTSTEDPSTEGLPTGGPEPEGAAPPESDAPEPEGPPTTQDAYGAFGAGVSLMFHAPDPDEIRRAADGLTPEELSRAKAQLKAGLLMGLESASAQAERLARCLAIWGRVPDAVEVAERIDAVDLGDVRAHALRLIETARPALALYGPVGKAPAREELAERLAA